MKNDMLPMLVDEFSGDNMFFAVPVGPFCQVALRDDSIGELVSFAVTKTAPSEIEITAYSRKKAALRKRDSKSIAYAIARYEGYTMLDLNKGKQGVGPIQYSKSLERLGFKLHFRKDSGTPPKHLPLNVNPQVVESCERMLRHFRTQVTRVGNPSDFWDDPHNHALKDC